MIDLRGRPIAITGASSGIGRAAALACADAGMPVAVGARRADRLEQLVAEITARGGRAVAVTMDVARPDDGRRLVERAVEAFGSLYAVFANAGVGLHKPIHHTTDDEMRAIFETNFHGTLNTIRPALPHLLAARAGHIVICSSCLSKVGTPLHGAYSATKSAQEHIARAMRIELAPAGIAVSSIHPIGTRTEFFQRAEAASGAADPAPASGPFMQSPERVARAVVRNLRSGRGREIWTSIPARLAFLFLNAFPATGDRFLAWGVRRWTGRTVK